MNIETLKYALELMLEKGVPGDTPITVGLPNGFNEQFSGLVIARGKYLDSFSTTCACLPTEGLYVRLESDSTDKSGEPWAGMEQEAVQPASEKITRAIRAFQYLPESYSYIIDISDPTNPEYINYTTVPDYEIGKLVECPDGTLEAYNADMQYIGKMCSYTDPNEYRLDFTGLGQYTYDETTKTYTPGWTRHK